MFISVSVFEGLSWPTSPAECQVVPSEISPFSKSTTSRQPHLGQMVGDARSSDPTAYDDSLSFISQPCASSAVVRPSVNSDL